MPWPDLTGERERDIEEWAIEAGIKTCNLCPLPGAPTDALLQRAHSAHLALTDLQEKLDARERELQNMKHFAIALILTLAVFIYIGLSK